MSKASHEKIVELVNVTKIIDEKILLHDISFAVLKGKCLAILGPNGAGKTTTLRLVTGIYKPSYGKVFTKDGIKIFYVSERNYSYEKYTMKENLRIFKEYFHLDEEKMQKYMRDFLLEEYINYPVYKMSKGNRRKLFLLIGLSSISDLYLLDEPNEGLDPLARRTLRNIIIDMKKQGKSFIIASHDLTEVEKTADDVVFIKKGEIVLSGKEKQIIKKFKSLENAYVKYISN